MAIIGMTKVESFKDADERRGQVSPHHVFAFGSPTGSIYGHMVLYPGGIINGYSHPNEAAWRSPADSVLEFVSESGAVTRRFHSHSGAVWLGQDSRGRQPFMLVSALHHDGAASLAPPIVVNSIPKSGTYLLIAALAAAGFPGSGLHLSGRRGVHDFRALPLEDWHRNPDRWFLDLPVEIVPLIAPGTVTAAHVEHHDLVAQMRAYGIPVLHVKRDLRDALLSLYRFKLNRVEPISDLDRAWRDLPEPQRLSAFLFYYAERDIAHMRQMAELVSGEACLAFEDMICGRVSPGVEGALDAIRPGLASSLAACLATVTGVQTSTLSDARSDWRRQWNSELDAVFSATGLKEANQALGYS